MEFPWLYALNTVNQRQLDQPNRLTLVKLSNCSHVFLIFVSIVSCVYIIYFCGEFKEYAGACVGAREHLCTFRLCWLYINVELYVWFVWLVVLSLVLFYRYKCVPTRFHFGNPSISALSVPGWLIFGSRCVDPLTVFALMGSTPTGLSSPFCLGWDLSSNEKDPFCLFII